MDVYSPTAGERAEVTLLGPVRLFKGPAVVDLGPPLQRTVFAILAAHAGQVVVRDELVEAVWGMDAPAGAMNSVYTYMARLRNLLEPGREMLVSDSLGYMLRLPPDQVDHHRFEESLKKARALHRGNDIQAATDELESGLSLWRGAAYGGAVGPFVEAERSRLAELRLTAAEDRVEMLIELGRYGDVIGELSGLVRRYPLRERLRYLLMLGNVRLGRQAEALKEYHDLRTLLADDQGIEPGDQLQQFYEEILRSGQARKGTDTVQDTATTSKPVALAQLVRDVPEFTGRATELTRLHQMISAAQQAGEAAVVLINGGPGVGKTALAVRLAHELASRFPDGQLQLDLRGYSGDSRPVTLGDALRQLITAVGGTGPLPADFERRTALYRSLVAGKRLLILLDNARYVGHIRPLLPGAASCLVIVTSRNMLPGLAVRDGARRIVLDTMDEADAIGLFGRMVDPHLLVQHYPEVRKLVAACGRHPLALRIAATRINFAPSPERALTQFSEGDPMHYFHVLGDEQSSLLTVFDWSYRALPDDPARVFRAIGRHTSPSITLETVASMVGAAPDVCRRWMEILVYANLVREPVQDHYQLDPLVFAYAQHLGVDSAMSAADRT